MDSEKSQPEKKMPATTTEKATVQPSATGPARYSGGVPMPETPSPGLTPEEGSVENASKAARETVSAAKAKLTSCSPPAKAGSSSRLGGVKKVGSPHDSPNLGASKRPVAQSSKSAATCDQESPKLASSCAPPSRQGSFNRLASPVKPRGSPHESPNLGASKRPASVTTKPTTQQNSPKHGPCAPPSKHQSFNRLSSPVKSRSPHESPSLGASRRPASMIQMKTDASKRTLTQSPKSAATSAQDPPTTAFRRSASVNQAQDLSKKSPMALPQDSPCVKPAGEPDQLTDKMKGRAHAVAVKTRIRVAVGRQSGEGTKLEFKSKADACDKTWFKTCFPEKEKEEVKAAYPCTYVDGRSAELHGRLVITNIGLHFGQGSKKKNQTRESVMFKKIAGMEVVHPAQLNVYTIDNKLLRFKEFETKTLAIAAAHDDVDLCWQCYGEKPNPAAIYYAS